MRGVRKLALLLIPLGIALTATYVAVGQSQTEALHPLPTIERIRIDKSERTMALYAKGRLVRVIRGLQLGDAPIGPKQVEGDERTPEGRYVIDWRNPDSAYHRSLHISYPDKTDEARARRLGKSPGGMIMIHGQPNWLPAGRLAGDWTDGCIAVSNPQMDALWDAVSDGTPVEIVP